MPRAKKTLSGQPAQPVAPVAGQMYGAGVEQAALQRSMPAPNERAGGVSPSGPATPPPPASPVPPPAPTSVDPMAALAAAQGLRGQAGLLNGATVRPEEPITTGVAAGPGLGPEALRTVRRSPAGEMLRELSLVTGNPRWAALADQARL